MATLTVTQDTDYRGAPVETNITDIVFQAATPGDSLLATFEPGQFGPGLISETVTITGDPGQANTFIEVEFAGAGSFSAAGWTFVNFEDDGFIYYLRHHRRPDDHRIVAGRPDRRVRRCGPHRRRGRRRHDPDLLPGPRRWHHDRRRCRRRQHRGLGNPRLHVGGHCGRRVAVLRHRHDRRSS